MTIAPEITEKFEVLSKLGEGGMGCVYKVRHRALDEIVIIKTLQAHLSTNEELKNRFMHEARRGVRLRHPRIAAVHDFSICQDGSGFIVMEYVAGQNLRDLMVVRGQLPLMNVVEIACQALDALEYLHARRIVHRDISPDNLMVTWLEDGSPSVKLIDLGIAKSLDNTMTSTMHTVAGLFIGKIMYASPEQFGRAAGTSEIDTRSDLYSMGIVLFELLTREVPFEGSSSQAIMAAHLFHPPRSFESTKKGAAVPLALQKVVYRALEKDPESRFQTAAEFREAVRHAAAGPEPKTLEDSVQTIINASVDQSVSQTVDRPAPTLPDTLPHHTTADARTLRDSLARTFVARLPKRAPQRWTAGLVAAALVIAVTIMAIKQRPPDPGLTTTDTAVTSAGVTLPKPAPTAAMGKFYAIVIGESQYRKLPSLETAKNDAQSIASLLRTQYGFEVELLVDATRAEIWQALEGSRQRVTANDNLIVFYAGHGTLDPINETGYWQPVDADPANTANWISAGQIAELLDYHPAKRALVIADSCYAGSIGLDPSATVRDGARQARMDRKSRMAWTSGNLQPILDAGDSQHSVFTRAVLNVMLRDSMPAELEVQDVYAAVRKEMKQSARRVAQEQEPQLTAILDAGHEGGGFLFVRAKS